MLPLLKPIVLAAMAGAALGLAARAEDATLADLLADPAVDLSRPADRARVVERLTGIEQTRRANAQVRAAQRGLPLRSVLPNGRIQELADFDAHGLPLYLTTHNANAAISTGANLLWPSPSSLNGSGVIIGLWDGGAARTTHQELSGRVTVKDGAGLGDHATHVCGTLIATGMKAAARGMANAATVDSYEWTNDTAEMTSRGATGPAQTGKIYLSNHSYGYISGWNQVHGGSPYRRWEWNGAGTTSTGVEDDFGRYNTYARDSDSLAFSAPYYLIFRSAGNDRGDSPVAGEAVALAPGSSTVVTYNPTTHPAGDASYRGGYDTISFNALAKNVITVGSVTDAVSNGSRSPAVAAVSSFSAWGPTDDGRIKPDVVANGDWVYSSLAGSDAAYDNYSGTSMATPNACGSAALLIQSYSSLFPSQAMRSSTLKGLLIHTADDLGTAGPDYQFGWGLINVKAAADLLRDHQAVPAKARLTENQLTTSTTSRTLSFVWDGVSPIVATLCWTDPAGSATTSSDSRTRRLVNDLNLRLIAPGGAVVSPYVMPFVGTWTQAAMSLPATTGVNTTDNVEQVRLAAPPAAGTYQAVVSISGTLTNGSQYYSLLISGSSAEPPPPPPLALAAVSPASGLSSGITPLTLTGTGLRADTAVKLTRAGEPNRAATGVQLSGETLTCQVDLTGAAAGVWNVVATNPNLETATLPNAFTVVGAVWAANFDGTVSGWTSQAAKGTNNWRLSTTRSQTPATSYFAPGPNRTSTTYLISPSIAIPAGATDLQLKFWHHYTLQSRKDGGRLELSIDNGAWFDVVAANSGVAFGSNGYVNTINSTSSDFPNLPVWTGSSGTFVETIVNFTDTAKFTGKSLRFRWGLATNNSTSSTGWYVDSVALIAGGNLTNQPPLITTAATSAATETVTDPDSTVYQIIRGATTSLSVTATDDAGDDAPTYTWAVVSGPASPVGFLANGTSAARTTVVEFSATGDYQLGVTVRDAQGLAGTSTVDLRVIQTATGLIVSPLAVTLPVGASQAFTATLIDQFSDPLAAQPPAIDWTASGGGTLQSSGLFTATQAGGPYSIHASAGEFSNTATVTITPGNDWVSWTAKNFSAAEQAAGLAGDLEDPDFDGFVNLAEYALGNDPRHYSPPLVAALEADGLSLTFTRPANLPGISYHAESSIDLETWTAVPLETIESGATETLRAQDSLATGEPSRRYLRLRFQRE
jgi:hypothetical protein